MNAVTIRFRAKLDSYAGGEGYRVPRLTHSHVTVDKRDALGTIFLQGLNDPDITRARLARLAGLQLPGIVLADAPGDWTITPIGNGFMADVAITRPLAR